MKHTLVTLAALAASAHAVDVFHARELQPSREQRQAEQVQPYRAQQVPPLRAGEPRPYRNEAVRAVRAEAGSGNRPSPPPAAAARDRAAAR